MTKDLFTISDSIGRSFRSKQFLNDLIEEINSLDTREKKHAYP
jgi:hypothetical protein